MKAFTFAAAAAALFSTTFAATVKLEETPCIQNNTELESFDVTLGTLFVKELKSVCGLKIVSADGADVNAIKCQAYKDAQGTDKGSAEFTFASPALIATNPVQEGSIMCSVGGTSTTLSVAPSGTGNASPTGGNATVPGVTGGPTSSPTGPSSPHSTGAASAIGMSVGALAAAMAALLL